MSGTKEVKENECIGWCGHKEGKEQFSSWVEMIVRKGVFGMRSHLKTYKLKQKKVYCT